MSRASTSAGGRGGGASEPLVLVVGSANMDMVVSCERFPQPGETLLGSGLEMYPGGKGANQAVACARLGGSVQFVGKLGADLFRDRLLGSLQESSVRTEHVLTDPGAPTGVAFILLDRSGQNEIVVAPGSNMNLSPADVEAQRSVFSEAAVVLLQLEIPLETVERAVELAGHYGARVILNPAPAQVLPDALLQQIDVLTPNATEAGLLTGHAVRDAASAERAGKELLGRGVRQVVVTLGAEGALLVTEGHTERFPAMPVEVRDTTAAGDAFNGALAQALAGGADLTAAVRIACAAGALAVTRRGAQHAMPTRGELMHFLAHQS